MFNSAILDTVIGVVVIFLQLSLVCTAINEFVALCLRKRAKELEKGIRTLLTSPQLVDKFYAHPLIQGLRPDERKPSYIPSRTFALALMDIVRRQSFDGAVTAATQAVAEREKERVMAQATVDAATIRLQTAHANGMAAAAALSTTTPPTPEATKAAEDATTQEAAAQTAKNDADTQLTAATAAKIKAREFLDQTTADAQAAKDAEAAAQAAEKAAKENPSKKDLQKAAAAARKSANEAADKLAPSASSLLTEARDHVADVQSAMVPPELKTALLALLDNAGANLNKAQANLEQWFDDSMDRVSGVYKRKSHVFIGIIAVIVVLLANVDTLLVANSLSHDKAVRDSLVAAAPELAKQAPTATPTPTPTPTPSPNPQANASGGSGAGAGSGAGTKAGNTGASGGNSSASTKPEPSITSIKASLDELNKLGLPIGYVRVCTRVEESVVDSCITETAAAGVETAAKTKLETAKTNADNAEKALQAAETELQTKEKDLKDSNDAAKSNDPKAIAKAKEAQDAANKAKETRDKATAARDNAATELTNAQNDHDKAEAPVKKIADLKTALATAEKDLAADPGNPEKQQAYREARSRVAFTSRCPKCRKASELTDDELNRRLPTTHDFEIFSGDFRSAVGALLGDSWNLLYSHWFGWLITAFAISLGAPFWFDTLNRIMVVRSTVKPHEKSREQESKDNPDEDDDKKKKKT